MFAHPADIQGVRDAVATMVDILAHSTLGARTLWPGGVPAGVFASRVKLIPTLKLLA